MTTRQAQLAQHHVTGLTITDTVLRFVVLAQHGHSVLPERYGEQLIPEGCLSNGKIVDRARFIAFLKKLRKTQKFDTVNIVLDSPQVQTLSLSVKGAAPLYVREALEKEFGLPAKDIVYDYKAVAGNDEVTVVQASAMAKSLSQDFLATFKSAGLRVGRIEPVAYALCRDVLPLEQQVNALLVHIDDSVTSLTFVVNGRVAQTMHFAFGDNAFTAAVVAKLSVSEDEAQRLKQDQGLLIHGSRALFDALVDDCVALVHHINETYISWRTAHPAVPPLESVYLTGSGSTLRGLDEYISVGLRVPVHLGNVWRNCFSFDEFIPALPQNESVRYAAAIGVALSSGHMANLLPYSHQKSMQRRHAVRLSGKILLSFVLGVMVGFGVARAVAIPSVRAKIVGTLHKIQARW